MFDRYSLIRGEKADVVVLMKSKSGNLMSKDIISKIKANVNSVKGLGSKTSTGGIIDDYKCFREAYYKIVDEQVDLEKKKLGKTFNEKEFKKELLYVLETKDSLKTLNSRDVSKIVPKWSYTISIRNSIVSAAINTSINVTLIAFGVGSVAALIKKQGAESARRIFYKTLYSRFMDWGATSLAVASVVAVDFIFNLLNPGEAIARWADSKDVRPNNGYLDVVVGW